MKKIFLFTLFYLTSFIGISQEIVHNSKEDPVKYFTDSTKYIFPEFRKGYVYFGEGYKSDGILNINIVNQKLFFIAPQGDTLILKNEDQVSRVMIGSTVFMKIKNQYFEIIDMVDDVILGFTRKIDFLEPEKAGAYGIASPATSVSRVSTLNDGGRTVFLNSDIITPYRYRKLPYFIKGGKTYSSSKKNLQKLIPSKKKLIEDFTVKEKIDFDNIEDLRALFIELTQ